MTRSRFLAGAVVLVSVYCGGIILIQRSILFPRPPVTFAPARPSDVVQVWLPTSVGPVEAWYLPPTKVSGHPAPVLLFFHGNAELIDFWPREFDEPRRWGVGVLLVEYPGYGRSSGFPSQSTIESAVFAGYDWLRTQPTIDAARVIAYGRSLGGAAAAILAANRPIAALILESAFTSVRSFAHRFGIPEFAVLDPFDSLTLMKSYAGAVLILHGEHDRIVPLRHSEQLARTARRSELHRLPCGHNDCLRPWALVKKFLIGKGTLVDEHVQTDAAQRESSETK